MPPLVPLSDRRPGFYVDYQSAALGHGNGIAMTTTTTTPVSPFSTASCVSSATTTSARSGAGFSDAGDEAKSPGPRPFACREPGCGRRFNRKFTLAEHMKTHTGEKPYKCPLAECGKRFSTSGNLARHKRLHKDIKPFDCPFAACQRTFPTEERLQHHVKIHTGDKVHVCGVLSCLKTFSTAGNLTRHTKLHHPEVDPATYLSARFRHKRVRAHSQHYVEPAGRPVSLPGARARSRSSLGSPSGVDSMDQRLDQLLIASPAPTAIPLASNPWAAAVAALGAPLDLADPLECEPRIKEEELPFGELPVHEASRYSLSVLDEIIAFELTEAIK